MARSLNCELHIVECTNDLSLWAHLVSLQQRAAAVSMCDPAHQDTSPLHTSRFSWTLHNLDAPHG